MNIKNTVFLTALACASAAFATSSKTAWFTVDMSSVTTSALKSAPWSVDDGATATIESGKLNLEATASQSVAYTPTTPTNAYHELAFKVNASYWDTTPTTPTDTFGALTIVKTNDVLRWAGLVTNADNVATWKIFTDIASPVSGSDYDLLIECDQIEKKVRYSVKLTTASSYTILSETVDSTTTSWFTSAYPITVSKVAFAGCGVFDDFSGTDVVETARKIEVSDGSGLKPAVDDNWLREKATAKGYTDQKAYLSSDGSNGLKVYQSYALGLDPNTATSKPLIKTVQDSSADKVSFQLGNCTYNANANMTVRYTVTEMESPSATTGTTTKDATLSSGSETVSFALPSSGVKYYKVGFTFDNPTTGN